MENNEENIRKIVEESFSYADCLRKINKQPFGQNYYYIKKLIRKYNLDISHFNPSKYAGKNATFKKKPIEEYLVKDKLIHVHQLKLRLVDEGIFEYKCYGCGITEWKNQRIPLELDHIDGDKTNNTLENLKILCPNCHSITPTYKRKNAKLAKPKKVYRCECGKQKKKRSKLCQACHLSNGNFIEVRQNTEHITKIQWMPDEELEKLVWSKPMKDLGKDLGVSDNAIRKRCKRIGIELPSRGYWLKKAIKKPQVKKKKPCSCGNMMKMTAKRCRRCVREKVYYAD